MSQKESTPWGTMPEHGEAFAESQMPYGPDSYPPEEGGCGDVYNTNTSPVSGQPVGIAGYDETVRNNPGNDLSWSPSWEGGTQDLFF